MAKVSVDLYYVRLSVHGGAYGWGPFKTQADAEAAAGLIGMTSNIPSPPFVEKETHDMDDAEVAKIHYHDGQFKGRGRQVV